MKKVKLTIVAIAMVAAVGILAAGGVVFLLVHLEQSTAAASQSTLDPQAALDEAFKAGLLTQDEYNAKLRTLSNSQSAPTRVPASPAAASRPRAAQPLDPAKVNWTTETLIDPMFNLPAYTVHLPADWKFEGAVVRTACEDAMPVFRAESPDGLYGVQLMPKVHWTYTQDPPARQYENTSCNFHAPVSALQQAGFIARQARPQSQVAAAQPTDLPQLVQRLAADNRAYEQNAAAYGQPAGAATHENGDAATILIHYTYQGQAEDEMMLVTAVVVNAPITVASAGSYGIAQGRMARAQYTDTSVRASRAPAGMLDAAAPFLLQIAAAPIKEYVDAVMAFRAGQFQKVQALGDAMFRNTLKSGEISHQNLMAQHDAYMQWQENSYAAQRQKFANDMQRKTANNQNFVDYVSDQTYYLNPQTGATVTVKNVPGTNGVITPGINGGWVALQPISH